MSFCLTLGFASWCDMYLVAAIVVFFVLSGFLALWIYDWSQSSRNYLISVCVASGVPLAFLSMSAKYDKLFLPGAVLIGLASVGLMCSYFAQEVKPPRQKPPQS